MKLMIKMQGSKNRTGFTLIELLIVIAIIAVLLTILVPALQKARQQARLALCGTNQHQLLMGLVQYSAENKDKLPPSPSLITRGNNKGNYHRPTELNWAENYIGFYQDDNYAGKYLRKYLSDVKVFNCPLAPIDPRTPWPPPSSGMSGAGTYGKFYESGAFTPLHSTYILLWNYQGYNHDVSDFVDLSRGHFEGPRTMSGKSKLVVQDTLFYLTTNVNMLWPTPQWSWYSSHPFEGSTNAQPYHTLYDKNETLLPEVWLNAGYLDGRVERFYSEKTKSVKNFQAVAYLTTIFW
jgi:prepilin-type N-terminal cleavage/methylation domain-containing protein